MGAKPKGISASRGAAVLGLNPWKTSLAVWQEIMEERDPGFNEKNGYELPEEPDNAAIRWGLAFESAICDLAGAERGETITDREKFYIDGDMTCHVDGLFTKDKDHHVALHEGKTTTVWGFQSAWGDPGTDRIPRQYQVQVQHQLALTGFDTCVVSVLVFPKSPEEWEEAGLTIEEICHFNGESYSYIVPTRNQDKVYPCYTWAYILNQMGFFHQYEIRRDEETGAALKKHYAEFWKRHVLTGEPPEPRDYEDIKRLCPNPTGTLVADAEVVSKIGEYRDIGKEIGKGGRLSKQREKLKVEVLDWARKQSDATIDAESQNKFVIRDKVGKKQASFSKDKNGKPIFRA